MSTPTSCQQSKEISHAIELVGDVHVLHIINSLSDGPLRFCELQRAVGDLNPVTLTSRLKLLENEKMIERHEETVDKISVMYELTKKGRGILPVIREIGTFAHTFL